jgi:hypothetical protein
MSLYLQRGRESSNLTARGQIQLLYLQSVKEYNDLTLCTGTNNVTVFATGQGIK